MEILITGSNGLLGKRLTMLAENEGNIVHAMEKDALDISNKEQVKKFFEIHHPEVIINCSVIQPKECEKNPEEAYKVNVQGVENLFEHKRSAKFIHFSSPAVFDGVRQLENIQYIKNNSFGFKESDQTRSVSIYGKTKIASEKILHDTEAVIIRTSWIYTTEKPFGLFASDIFPTNDIGRPTFTDDIWGAAKILLRENSRGIFHVCGPEVMSRHEQAVRVGIKPLSIELERDSIRPLAISKIFPLLERYGFKLYG